MERSKNESPKKIKDGATIVNVRMDTEAESDPV
jgi:hypothetical protein